MSGQPQVTVIVWGRNGDACRLRCLAALEATAGVAFDAVVAPGPGAARRAAAASRGTHLAFLASHAVVPPGWLRALLDALAADETVGAACATLVWRDQPDLLISAGGRITWPGVAYDNRRNCPLPPAGGPRWRETSFPSGAAMLTSRRDWDASGGFDPAMRAGNADADLGWRLWLLGRRVVVCADAVVAAEGSQADAGERRHGWVGAALLRQTLRTVITAYPPRYLLHVLRWTVRARLASGAWRPLALALAWNLVHLPGTLRRRRRLQSARAAAHEALFARGVIVELAEPPAAPVRVRGSAMVGRRDWIASDVLLPGADSALGRLGPGWFAPERFDGTVARRTAEVARCVLRVEPGAAGTLRVDLAAADGGDPGEVTVSCNGAAAREFASRGRIEVPVRSRGDGMLEVELRCPADPRGRSGGPEGCAVREIRFLPDAPAARAPGSSISVIIPTYNRWPILAETLAALAAQTLREFEVIVVDDGSTDGTWESLLAWREAHPEVALLPIRQANLKPGRARNNALRHVTGDVVLFLGDDIIPSPTLLAEHLARHRAAGEAIGVLGHTSWDRGRMEVTPFLEFVNDDGAQFAYGHFSDGGDVPFTGFYTSNISLPRDVLGEDPFHPAFTFVDWEDIELGYRLSLRGLRLVYHAAARATHVHPSTLRGFFRRQEHVGRTVGVILGLHPELEHSPAMPPIEPAPWYRWARLALPPLLPLLQAWDRAGRRLPVRLARNALLVAFWNGVRSTRPVVTG